jgi:hypothetical protein
MFQMNMKWRDQLNTMYDAKLTEYNTAIGKYEKIAGKADKTLALDQTEAFVDILGDSFANSSEELVGDITALKTLIKQADETIQKVKGRNIILGDIQYEMSKRTDAYKYYVKSEEELELGIPLWTQEDFAHMMEDIMQDEDFLKRNGLMDKNGNIKDIPEYLKQYKEGMSTPDDAKLQALNTEIFNHEAKKLQLSINQFNKTLKQRESEITLSPDVIFTQEIQKLLSSAEKMDAALAYMPGFTASYTKNFQAAQRYEESMNTTEVQNLHNPQVVKSVAARALSLGLINEEQYEGFNAGHAKSFIEIEASLNMMKQSSLAIVAGPAYLRSVYAREHRSYAAFGNLVLAAADRITEFYQLGNTRDDKALKQQMLVEWGKSMGMTDADGKLLKFEDGRVTSAQEVSIISMIDSTLAEIQTLIGEDADMDTNPFKIAMETLKSSETKLQDIITKGPTGTNLKNQQLGLFNSSEIQIAVINMSASCAGSGGAWNNALGICDNTKVTSPVIPTPTSGVPLRLMQDMEDERELREEWNKLHENTPGAQIYNIESGEVKYN